jgi:hypothetical protein
MQTDTDSPGGNVTPIRRLDDEAALAWLRAQPGGRTKLSDAELGRRWGWKRQRVGRRVKAWVKDGRISRRGNTITYTPVAGAEPATQAEPVPPSVPSPAPLLVPPAVPPAVLSLVPPRAIKDVRLPIASKVDVQVPGRRHGAGIRLAALTAALALATVSGGFSITGMTSIFVGAYWPVIGMGVALEVGKLSAVAWLGHQRGTGSWQLRAALAILVAVLMGLNAVGCYGFLARAHIGHQVEGETVVSARAADIEARLAVQAEKVADLTKQVADLDAARTIETPSAGNLRTASAISAQAAALAAAAKLRAADDERRQAKRTSLANKLTVEAKALADLKIEKAKVDGEKKVAEADLGPVRYLAKMIGGDDQDVLRWFILVIAVLLDPAAVLLLLAATRRSS